MFKIFSLVLTLLPSGVSNLPKEKLIKLVSVVIILAAVWLMATRIMEHREITKKIEVESQKIALTKEREDNARLYKELADLNKKLKTEKAIQDTLRKSINELASREKALGVQIGESRKALEAANKKLEILQGNLTNDAINNPEDNIRSTNDYILTRLREYERITSGSTGNN